MTVFKGEAKDVIGDPQPAGEKISVSVFECLLDKTVTILAVKGFIDTTTVSEFEKKFKEVLREKKFKLLVDLTGVAYIGSAGWGIFVSEIRGIRNMRGDVILVGMDPQVTEVFELLEFNVILKSFRNVAAAITNGFK